MAPTPEDLECSVIWSVIRAAHVLEREVTALFASFELSPVQFGVLAYLGANGPMTTAALARSVLVRPQSLAGVISTLEARELLARRGQRGRGRASPVVLTPAGEELLGTVWPAFRTADKALADDLPVAQTGTLTAMLRSVTTRDGAG